MDGWQLLSNSGGHWQGFRLFPVASCSLQFFFSKSFWVCLLDGVPPNVSHAPLTAALLLLFYARGGTAAASSLLQHQLSPVAHISEPPLHCIRLCLIYLTYPLYLESAYLNGIRSFKHVINKVQPLRKISDIILGLIKLKSLFLFAKVILNI